MRRVGITVATLALSAVGLGGCGDSLAAPTILTVTVTAPKQTIAVGESVQLTAVARDVNAVSVPGARITYSTSASTIVSVTSEGRITGVAPGSATVTATAGVVNSPPFPVTVTAASVVGRAGR